MKGERLLCVKGGTVGSWVLRERGKYWSGYKNDPPNLGYRECDWRRRRRRGGQTLSGRMGVTSKSRIVQFHGHEYDPKARKVSRRRCVLCWGGKARGKPNGLNCLPEE